MNASRQSLPWWQLLFTFVVFIAVLGLAYFYREQITAIVLVPILYLLWVVDLALQMLGQQCIWSLALMIALILSLVFSRRNEKPLKDLDRTVYGRGPAVGRIQLWRRRVRVNSNAIHAVSYRRSEIRQLLIRALAYRENSNPRDIEERLRSGQIHVPADLSNILGVDDQPVEARKPIGLIEFIKLRLEWITGRFITSNYAPDPRIEKVAEFLESIMEDDNDAKNN